MSEPIRLEIPDDVSRPTFPEFVDLVHRMRDLYRSLQSKQSRGERLDPKELLALAHLERRVDDAIRRCRVGEENPFAPAAGAGI